MAPATNRRYKALSMATIAIVLALAPHPAEANLFSSIKEVVYNGINPNAGVTKDVGIYSIPSPAASASQYLSGLLSAGKSLTGSIANIGKKSAHVAVGKPWTQLKSGDYSDDDVEKAYKAGLGSWSAPKPPSSVPRWLSPYTASTSFALDTPVVSLDGSVTINLGELVRLAKVAARAAVRALNYAYWIGRAQLEFIWNVFELSLPLIDAVGREIIRIAYRVKRRILIASLEALELGKELIILEQRLIRIAAAGVAAEIVETADEIASSLQVILDFEDYLTYSLAYRAAENADRAGALADFLYHWQLHRVVEYCDDVSVQDSTSYIDLYNDPKKIKYAPIKYDAFPGTATQAPISSGLFAMTDIASGCTVNVKTKYAPVNAQINAALNTTIPSDGCQFDFQIDNYPYKYPKEKHPRLALVSSVASLHKTKYVDGDSIKISPDSHGQIKWAPVATAAVAAPGGGLVSQYVSVKADTSDVCAIPNNKYEGVKAKFDATRDYDVSYVTHKFDDECKYPMPVSLLWDPEPSANHVALDLAAAQGTLNADGPALVEQYKATIASTTSDSSATASGFSLPIYAYVGIGVGFAVLIAAIVVTVMTTRKRRTPMTPAGSSDRLDLHKDHLMMRRGRQMSDI